MQHGEAAVRPVAHVAAEQLPGDAAAVLPAAPADGAAVSLPSYLHHGAGHHAAAAAARGVWW